MFCTICKLLQVHTVSINALPSRCLCLFSRPTNAYRQNLAKLAKEAVDKAKFGIRRVRNNIVSDVKKLQSVSRDDTKRYEEQVGQEILAGKLF